MIRILHPNQMFLVELPSEILTRIAFLVYFACGLGGLVNLQRTCKKFHLEFRNLLFTIKPLTFSDKKHKNKSISRKQLKILDHRLLEHVQVLNYWSSSWKNLRLVHFRALTVLSVKTNNVALFWEIQSCPCLANLTFMFDSVFLTASSIRAAMHRDLAVFPQLEMFRISSAKPVVKDPFRSLVSTSPRNPLTVDDFRRFFTSKRAKFLLMFYSQSLDHQLGQLFVRVAKMSKALKILEVYNFDFAFLATPFPNLHLLVVDNASIVHFYTWIKKLKGAPGIVLVEDRVLNVNLLLSGENWKVGVETREAVRELKRVVRENRENG